MCEKIKIIVGTDLVTENIIPEDIDLVEAIVRSETPGLSIKFYSDEKRMRILIFFKRFASFRLSDEGLLLKLHEQMSEARKKGSRFQQLHDCDYKIWASDQSYEIPKLLKSFIFIGRDEVVEVLGSEAPAITFEDFGYR